MPAPKIRTNWAIWLRFATLACLAVICGVALKDAIARQQGAVEGRSLAKGLQFDNTSLMLDEIHSGVPFSCQFTFRNAGSTPVDIVEVRPGCGCLKPRLDKQTLEPGQRGHIDLEVRTLGQAAGPHTWNLTCIYNDGADMRELALHVTATVVTEVTVQPASLTLFTSSTLSHDLVLTDMRPEPLHITRVEMTSPYFHVKAEPFIKDQFGYFTSKITVETTADMPFGRHEEFLMIYSSDGFYSEFKIPITVVKQERASKN